MVKSGEVNERSGQTCRFALKSRQNLERFQMPITAGGPATMETLWPCGLCRRYASVGHPYRPTPFE
jgi:hypothetical protein